MVVDISGSEFSESDSTLKIRSKIPAIYFQFETDTQKFFALGNGKLNVYANQHTFNMTYFRNFIKLNNADPKPEKVEKEKKKYSFRKKPTGEREIFAKIWSERPHYCQICFTPIPEATPTNFLHVLAKGLNKYPKLKLNPQNIILGCPDCHHIWDHARHKADTQEWKWMFELEYSLKEQYKKL